MIEVTGETQAGSKAQVPRTQSRNITSRPSRQSAQQLPQSHSQASQLQQWLGKGRRLDPESLFGVNWVTAAFRETLPVDLGICFLKLSWWISFRKRTSCYHTSRIISYLRDGRTIWIPLPKLVLTALSDTDTNERNHGTLKGHFKCPTRCVPHGTKGQLSC